MSAINWLQYTELMTGRNAPVLADTLNRPLRAVLTASGYDPDADFGVGFAKTIHTHVAANVTDLTTANTGITSVGTIATGVWQGTPVAAAYLGAHTHPFSAITGSATPTQGGTGLAVYALGDLLYASAINTLAALAGNATATKKFLTQTGTGSASAAPAWGIVSAADVNPGTLAGSFTFSSALVLSAGASVTGTVTATAFAGPLTGNVTGNVTGALAGNASTATALATPRMIGGASFDGTANITIGFATTAATFQTARAINGVNFDGSAAITVTAAAGTLTGATLAANVLASSLTSVGVLAAPHMTGAVVDSGGFTVTLGGAAITGNSTITGTLTGLTGITSSGTAALATITASALATLSAGLTVSAGTTAVQALTATTINGTGIATISHASAGTSVVVANPTHATYTGASFFSQATRAANVGFQHFYATSNGVQVAIINGDGSAAFAAGLTVSAGGLTVSAGTTSVQALTATGNFQVLSAASFAASTYAVSIGNAGISSNYFKGDNTYFQNAAGTQIASLASTGALTAAGGFGCNGNAAQAKYASAGTLAGVVAALIANGILSS